MASRDLHDNIKASRAIDPAAITTPGQVITSQIIDTQGYGSLEFLIVSGALTDGTLTPAVYESDDSGMSGETVVTTELEGTVAGATFAITDDNVVKKIGYRGSKRYVRLKVTVGAGATGGYWNAVAVQGHPRNAPAGGTIL